MSDELKIQERNPVLSYADSYRSMAKQDVESVPIWSVITDIERNISPLYTTLLAEREADKALIAELQRKLIHREFLLETADQVQKEYAEALGCAGDNESILEAIDGLQDQVRTIDMSNSVLNARIAELEARTLTVKLPDDCEHDVIAPVSSFMYQSGFEIDTEDYNALAGRVRSEVETVMRRTLRAAGITLKVGGEDATNA